MGSGIPHAPFPANSIKTTERVNSGAVPPPSPFFAGEDDISADQLDFDDYGMSSASSEGGSGVSLEHQFSGLLCWAAACCSSQEAALGWRMFHLTA